MRERKVIFFVDDLHLSLDSPPRTRSAIVHFTDDEMMPRDNVLIVSASGQNGLLQQFTDYKTVLRAALARLKFIPFATRDNRAARINLARANLSFSLPTAFFSVQKTTVRLITSDFSALLIRRLVREARFTRLTRGLFSLQSDAIGERPSDPRNDLTERVTYAPQVFCAN